MKNKMQPISSDDTHSKHKDIFKGRYYRFTKQLLWTAGLWPTQPIKPKVFKLIILVIVSLIVMGAQVLAMIKAWGRFSLFAECITPLVTNFGGLIKSFSCLYNRKEMADIFNQMQKDWDDKQHSSQTKILEKYAEKGRRWTVFYFTMYYSICFLWVSLSLTPKILDIVVPLNDTRPTFELFPVDFMVDPDVYFFPIIGFVTFGVCYVLLIFVATDTLYMVLALHVCAEYEVLRCYFIREQVTNVTPQLPPGSPSRVRPFQFDHSHYIHHMRRTLREVNIYDLYNVLEDVESTDVILKPRIDNDMHYHKIILCIKKHKIITEHAKRVGSTCEWKLFFIVGLSMMALSFTGYVVIATRIEGTLMDTLRFVFFGIAQIFHLYCNTLPGHWISDSSSQVPNYAYSCHWYLMSMRSRKLILFLIRASIEPCQITAGKIYVMSVENFSSALQTSMSYLTMLNSVQ